MYGEHALHLSPENAALASNVTHKMMHTNEGMYPFYREALAHTNYLRADLNKTLGGFIRQEFKLWEKCGDAATDVSEEILHRVWRRLG